MVRQHTTIEAPYVQYVQFGPSIVLSVSRPLVILFSFWLPFFSVYYNSFLFTFYSGEMTPKKMHPWRHQPELVPTCDLVRKYITRGRGTLNTIEAPDPRLDN